MPIFEISAETWATLNSLLDRALDLAPSERLPWVDALGPEYQALKPQLCDLISRTGVLRTSQILGTFATFRTLADDQSEAVSLAAAGDLFGPYRLIRELGEGGMSTVWLAERYDGLISRPVALKLPRRSRQSAALAERMAREREILATLNHPNIARLYDAGITGEGQPYLALEYVEGVRIDQFVADAKLDLRRLLALFLQVTDAVAHAHSQLVVHRDLKPSNILVTAAGQARLLDFGIAKLLDQGEAAETQLTEQCGRALTPDYASPEQIAGSPISTASDVYSLGVVLYELLTGVPPYRLKHNLRGSLEEAILQSDPSKPSGVARDGSMKIALRGDLDWIVLKAMAKERDRRYALGSELGAEIRRFLRDEPVEASPPSASYRIGKFVRRHRVAVTAGTLLVLALMAGTVGTTAGMLRARRAEASARTEAATAARYSTFLVDMFETAAPEESKGRVIGAREMLEHGAARVRKELVNQPQLQARLFATIGWVYTRQGLYPQARPMLDEAVGLARQQGEAGKVDLAQALVRRGQLERYLNEPDKAESDDREALKILERVYGPNDVNVEPAVSELGLLLRMRDPEQALRLYSRSRDLLITAHGEADGNAAVLLGNIGAIHNRAHRYQEARDAYEQALPLLRRHFGERDPHVAAALDNLGFAYCSLGDYGRAFEMAQRGLEVDTAVSGPDHPDVGLSLLNLARISDIVGDQRSALEQVDRAIEIFGRRFPPAHPQRIRAANLKAGFVFERGRLAEARKMLQDLLLVEGVSAESKLALLNGRVLLADVERLDKQAFKSKELARGVLADPVVRSDRRLEANAHWAHAYALATLEEKEEAERERIRALAMEEELAHGIAFPGVFADAKYHICAGDTPQALAILRDAASKGFHDPILLHDPTFTSVRNTPEFAPIAAAITPHLHTAEAKR